MTSGAVSDAECSSWRDSRQLVAGLIFDGRPTEGANRAFRRLTEALLAARPQDADTAEMTRMTGWKGGSSLDWVTLDRSALFDDLAVFVNGPVPDDHDYEAVAMWIPKLRSRLLDGYGPPLWSGRVELSDRRGEVLTAAFGRVVEAMGDVARDLDVLCGFVTEDFAFGFAPYVPVVGFNLWQVDWARFALGYYWGNLWSEGHLGALGGADAVAAWPGVTVSPVGDRNWWVQLDAPYPTCDVARLRQLRDRMEPILPQGARTVDEYFELEPPTVVQQFCL